ncbi:MAG: HEAT repeat domain-containing protein [Sedimentisphaerales bacterium]|nr:HEAT repeat domain-containing protein [Sedimentisphaerales bacterium]
MQRRTTLVTQVSMLLLATVCLGQTELADIPRLIEQSACPESRITEAEEQVARSIQQLGPDAIPYLLPLLEHENEYVRKLTSYTLRGMGVPEALPVLVKRLTEKPDRRVFSAIAGLGDSGRAAGPALVPYLSSNDWDIRIEAAKAMGHIGYREGIPPLVKLLKTEDDWRLVYVSAESLGRLHAADAIPALTDVSKGHWYRHVRAAAEKAILVIQDKMTYMAQDREAKAKAMLLPSDFVGIETWDDASAERDLRRNHPPYVDQPDHLNKEQLKKLAYKAQVGCVDSTEAGAVTTRVQTVERVPQVGIRVADGFLLGSNRGEFGRELVLVDSSGRQTTLLS